MNVLQPFLEIWHCAIMHIFFWVATHMSHDNACTYSIKSNAIAFIVYCIKYKDHRILKWLKKDALDDKIVHFPSYLIYWSSDLKIEKKFYLLHFHRQIPIYLCINLVHLSYLLYCNIFSSSKGPLRRKMQKNYDPADQHWLRF